MPPRVGAAVPDASAEPESGEPCHLAVGVTPAQPRMCVPCAHAIHFEQHGFMGPVGDLDVSSAGNAVWKRRERLDLPEKTWAATLTPAEMEAFRRAMAERHLCSVRSRRLGIPDEATQMISACLPGVECEIMAWAGEWEATPDGKAILRALDDVIDAVLKRGAPGAGGP